MMQEAESCVRARAGVVVLLTAGMLVACGATEPEAAAPEAAVGTVAGDADEDLAAVMDSPLAGTQWRLVEFQSMDDTIGVIRPESLQVYTMQLGRDGSVSMQLNCNRGTGSWSAEPGEDGRSGRFELGPLATTRGLCPPPSMDERIAADAAYVRGYLLRDGRLYLSLMADAGIYTWEPDAGAREGGDGVTFDTTPDPELEEAIRRASPDYTREIVEIGGTRGRYLHGRFDLDGDGRDEVFAYLLGSIFCGSGGCNLLLFVDGDDGYTLVNEFPISRLPIIVSDRKSEGWHDLVRLESGGGAPQSYVRHAYDGERYAEGGRLPAEPAPEGARVLAGEYTFEDGIPLAPRD